MALLEALEGQLPHSFAGLFDGEGRIIWMSERSAARLGLTPRRHGKRRLSAQHSRELEAIRGVVRAAGEDLTPRRLGIWPRERLLIRRVVVAGRSAVLLVARSTGEPEWDRTDGLSRREAEVAELAIRGYSIANIAARLALKEQTIKTFLKRVYSKLQVRNRAELCYELLSPRRARSG